MLTREKLLADVWDWVDASGTRTVDSHVKALRRKLGPGPDPHRPRRRLLAELGRPATRGRRRSRERRRRRVRRREPGRPACRVRTCARSTGSLDQDQARRAGRRRPARPRPLSSGPACTPGWPPGTRCRCRCCSRWPSPRCWRAGMTSPLREMTAAAAGDGARRLQPAGAARPAATRSASWPARSTGWPRTSAAVDRQRRELVANVSHELRTPVSALRAVLENLVDGVDRARRRRRCGPRWPRPSGWATWSTQLLDLSRVEAGAVPLRRAARAAAGVPQPTCVERGRSSPGATVRYAAGRRTRRTCRSTPTATGCTRWWPTCSTTPPGTRPPGGTVTARARAGGRRRCSTWSTRGRASPRATGRGCSSGSTAAALGRSDGGTGLGLAIARWVVDLHGGSIRVVETDAGCRIRVTLPA